MSSSQRKSSYPLISVDEALSIVLSNTITLPPRTLNLMESVGHIIAQNKYAKGPIPSFPTSIMDGYAVMAPIEPGIFKVQDRVHAGAADVSPISSNDIVAYITTGAKVPSGANAVVKIEDTESVVEEGGIERSVKINVSAKAGLSIRQIGSDMKDGELVLEEGDYIGPAEVGLLATLGFKEVLCRAKPIVGVMSTGNELVDVGVDPEGTQIRDSNRAAILASLIEEGVPVIDLGIMKDDKTVLTAAILAAAERCDVVITSGGVSMGEADLVKPLLEQLGQVKFGRINMKPGKPTTFAVLPSSTRSTCLFFALPGNPVSCLVTKALLVDPAIKRLQGLDPSKCLYPEVSAITEAALELDPERPEYHRAIVSFDVAGSGCLVARSTGMQRSSRLLSMKFANALLVLPQQSGSLPAGSKVTALLVRPLPAPAPSQSMFRSIIGGQTATAAVTAAIPPVSSSKVPSMAMYLEGNADWSRRPMRVAILTISDRASAGQYADESGPELARLVLALPTLLLQYPWPCGVEVVQTAIVPDEIDQIRSQIIAWTDGEHCAADVILSTGGTGFGPRDTTPEAVKGILHREAAGVAQALLSEGLKHTPLAVLSRPVAGTRHATFIATLPGSVKAVRENLTALQPLLPRIVQLLRSGSCEFHGK